MTDIEIGGIKGWKEDDQPREKCLIHGISSLSDAELIAILLGSGTKNKSAVDVGRDILKFSGNTFNKLGKLGYLELCSIAGVGRAKAVTLLAAFEIGRRRNLENVANADFVVSSRQAAEFFIGLLSDLCYEEFWILLLNHSNRVLGKVKISSGGVHQTLVDPKHIFNEALRHLATGIILCHNHPSGSVQPSVSDVQLTRKIVSAAESLEIRIVDHIIVGGNKYYSFSDSNLL